MPAPAAAPAAKEIPYDYVAKFILQGKRGNRVQDVINISIEGAFVAAAIGYSFIPPSWRTFTSTPIKVSVRRSVYPGSGQQRHAERDYCRR